MKKRERKNQMDKKVSIIVPIYNGEKFLRQCLDSLLGQTYENFEIVCVNDASKDNSLKVLKEYKEKNGKIVIISNEKNSGPSFTRNRGVKYAIENGADFISFVDCDDWVENDYLSTLINLFEKDTVFTSCRFHYEKRSSKHFKNKKEKVSKFDLKDALCEVVTDKNCFGFAWNKMFKAELIGDLLFKKSAGEDLIFAINYLDQCKKGNVKHSSKKLYHYIKTKGSLSGLKTNEKKFKRQRPFFDDLDTLRERHKDNNDFVERINAWYFLMSLQFCLYSKKLKYKDENKFFKAKLKEYKNDYKKQIKNYSSFRKLGVILYYLIKLFA